MEMHGCLDLCVDDNVTRVILKVGNYGQPTRQQAFLLKLEDQSEVGSFFSCLSLCERKWNFLTPNFTSKDPHFPERKGPESLVVMIFGPFLPASE